MPPHKAHGPAKEGRGRGRLAKACAQCRTGKTRCDFAPDAERCNRCISRGITCIPYGSTAAPPAPVSKVEKNAYSRRRSSASSASKARAAANASTNSATATAARRASHPSAANTNTTTIGDESPSSSDAAVSPYRAPEHSASHNSSHASSHSGSHSGSRAAHRRASQPAKSAATDAADASFSDAKYEAFDAEHARKLSDAERTSSHHRFAEDARSRRSSVAYAASSSTSISVATSDATPPAFFAPGAASRSNSDTSQASSGRGYSVTSSPGDPLALDGAPDDGEIDVDEDDMNADMGLELEFAADESPLAAAHAASPFSPQTESFLRAQGVHGLASEMSAGHFPARSQTYSSHGGLGGATPDATAQTTPVGSSFPFGVAPSSISHAAPGWADAAADYASDAQSDAASQSSNIGQPAYHHHSKSVSAEGSASNGVREGATEGGTSTTEGGRSTEGVSTEGRSTEGGVSTEGTSTSTDHTSTGASTLNNASPATNALPEDDAPYTLDASSRKAASYPYFQHLDAVSPEGPKPGVPAPRPQPVGASSSTRPEYADRLGPSTHARSLAGGPSHFQDSVTHMASCAIGPGSQSRMGSASSLMANPSTPLSARNVITAKIMSRHEVVKLIDSFKGNYDHWIGSPEGDTGAVVDDLSQKCPSLVTTCCSIASRFGSVRSWQTIYPSLVRYSSSELAQTLVQPPENTECVQAFTVLAKYADSSSFGDQVFDMWSISGTGIQHLEKVAGARGEFSYTHMRSWNHSVLAHSCSANTTGRQVVVSPQGMESCTRVSSEPTPTRFDKCMVAESMIQWQTNRYSNYQIRFREFEREVAQWRAQWGPLAQSPMIQFIEPVSSFCSFSTRWTHARRCWQVRSHRQTTNQSTNQTTGQTISQTTNQGMHNTLCANMSSAMSSASSSAGSCANLATSKGDDSDFEDAAYHGARSPVSPLSLSEDSGASMENMYTSESLAELNSSNAIIMSSSQLVEPKYFVCLSDSIHQIGFLSGVMALVISRIISRREPYSRDVAKPLEVCEQLVRQLAVRFRATSRGYDVAHTQCAASSESLGTVNLTTMTPPSTSTT